MLLLPPRLAASPSASLGDDESRLRGDFGVLPKGGR
jgi:hypothetical protein